MVGPLRTLVPCSVRINDGFQLLVGEKWAVVGGSTPPVVTVLAVRPRQAVAT